MTQPTYDQIAKDAAVLTNNFDTFYQAITGTATQFTEMLQLLAPFLLNARQPWWPLDVTDTSGSFGRFVWVNSDDCGWGYCFWEDDDIE
jgi:hypothetical protein